MPRKKYLKAASVLVAVRLVALFFDAAYVRGKWTFSFLLPPYFSAFSSALLFLAAFISGLCVLAGCLKGKPMFAALGIGLNLALSFAATLIF